MAWSQIGSTWLLAGDGTRQAVVADEPLPGDAAFKVQIDDPEDEVRVFVKASPDGRSCWEVYTVGGGTAVIRLRVTTFGVAAAHVKTATYAAAGLAAGVPFVLDVRLIQNEIQVRVNGNNTVVFSNTDTTGTFDNYDRYGFAAVTTGARVVDAELCELTPILSERRDVLLAVCGGELWACEEESKGIKLVSPLVAKGFGEVDIAEFEQRGYIVDGSNGRVYTASTAAVALWTPTAGSLPGASAAGKTTAVNLEPHLGRLFAGGMKADPQNIMASAVNDALDWNTGNGLNGGAFSLTAALAAHIGQPVKGLLSITDSRLYIFCQRSTWRLTGDPSLGAVDVNPISLEFGASGKDAATLADPYGVAAHSPSGFVLFDDNGGVPISQPILTDFIKLTDALENYIVQVVRDPERNGTHIFLTARAGGTSTHFWYDETVGGFSGGRVVDGELVNHPGGFFPEQYPERVGPTASTYWNGRVILGGRDGYLYVFDSAAAYEGSDDGTAITSRATLGLVVDESIEHDTLVHRTRLLLSDDSDPVLLTVYGGVTAEEAYGEAGTRWKVFERTTSQRVNIWSGDYRAPALVMVLSNSTLGRTWAVEECELVSTAAALTRRRRETPAAAAAVAVEIGAIYVPYDAVMPVPSYTAYAMMTGQMDTTGSPGTSGQSEPPSPFPGGFGAGIQTVVS